MTAFPPSRRWLLVLAALCLAVPAVGAQATSRRETDSTVLVLRRPTVIAYLTLAPGAVDSSPDVAVLADDWAYAMATLGDSVEARGYAFVLWTQPRVIVRRPGHARADTLFLG